MARAVWKPRPDLSHLGRVLADRRRPAPHRADQARRRRRRCATSPRWSAPSCWSSTPTPRRRLRRPHPLEPGLLPAGPRPDRLAVTPTSLNTDDRSTGGAAPHGEHDARWRDRGRGASALAAALAACGSSEKTVGPGAGAPASATPRRRAALIGVTMPTKSSERWIARRRQRQGRAGEARLQGRPAVRRERHPDPGQPDREPDHQGRQAADHRLDRRHRDHHPAAGGGGQEHPGHRLRPADPQQPERRLLRHLRQLQGRRAAGHLAAGRPGPARRRTAPTAPPRARSTSSCSPARRTTTTPRSSSTARCRCSSRYIDKGTLVVKSGQTDFKTVAILRWDPATAQKRMEDLLTSTYSGGAKVDGVLSPVRRPVHRHPVGAEEQRLRHRRPALPDRHRPGRRGRLGEVDHRR